MSDGLAARAWRAVAAATATVVGGANALGRATAGWTASTVGDLGRAAITAGLSVAQRVTGVVATTVGWSVSLITTGTTQAAQSIAWVASTVGTLARPSAMSGLKVQQVTYAYTGTRNGSGGTGYVVATRNDWTSPANAAGARNGTLSSFAGNALGARAGGVDVTLPGITGKTALAITSVKLRFYARQAGTVLGNGTLKYGYKTSAGTRVQLAAPTGDVDGLTTPLEHDLTALVGGDWNAFGTVLAGAYVEASTAVLNTHTADLDAVELVVTATLTDTY
jgi:hypothetical protein